MKSVFTLDDVDGEFSLTFSCDLPVDAAIAAAGHDPNGYFWESVARYVFDEAADVQFDSEAGMFCAVGDRSTLEALRLTMSGYLSDAAAVTALITRAEVDGFEFDD
jgi:hypothetical protein